MIRIIDHHLAPENRQLLQSMFADRKRLFVDLFGWDVPVIDGAYGLVTVLRRSLESLELDQGDRRDDEA